MRAKDHRWTTGILHMVIWFDWFLRYLETFAFLEGEAMLSCSEELFNRPHVDWKQCLHDGRVEWTNSQ